jgi:hypothetical protein
VERHQARLRRERDKGQYAFDARRATIERIGLPNVRQKRWADLAAEEERWAAGLRAQSVIMPDLEAVVMLKVEPLVERETQDVKREGERCPRENPPLSPS